MGSRYEEYWPPYVPVAQRREEAKAALAKLKRKGVDCQPVAVEGRAIARTFWGKKWCANLEAYSDFANRLPRGRSCVRNGAVLDLLKVLLKAVAEAERVAPKIIASSDDLEAIASDDEAEVPALQGWRREVFGDKALALKSGELGLRIVRAMAGQLGGRFEMSRLDAVAVAR